MGLKFSGIRGKGEIVLGNMVITRKDVGFIKPTSALPKDFDMVRDPTVTSAAGDYRGVDLELKKDGFYWHGKKKIIPGANWRVLDRYGSAFGYRGVRAWFKSPEGVSVNRDIVEKDFARIRNAGIKKVRIWLLDDGRAVLNKQGHVIGYDRIFKDDVRTFLDLAEKYGVAVEFTLVDYLVAGRRENVDGVWVRGRRKIFTDKDIRKEFISRFVVPLVRDFGNHPAFRVVDLGNELEWLVDASEGGGWDTIKDLSARGDPVPLKDIVSYLDETAGAIKKNAPDMIITGGFNSVSNPGLYKYLDGKVDYIAAHWYPKFGDINRLLRRAKKISSGMGIPIALEEFPSVSSEFDKMLEVVSRKGYIGADFWNLTPSADDQTSSASRLSKQLKRLREFIKSKSTLYSVFPGFVLFSPTFNPYAGDWMTVLFFLVAGSSLTMAFLAALSMKVFKAFIRSS